MSRHGRKQKQQQRHHPGNKYKEFSQAEKVAREAEENAAKRQQSSSPSQTVSNSYYGQVVQEVRSFKESEDERIKRFAQELALKKHKSPTERREDWKRIMAEKAARRNAPREYLGPESSLSEPLKYWALDIAVENEADWARIEGRLPDCFYVGGDKQRRSYVLRNAMPESNITGIRREITGGRYKECAVRLLTTPEHEQAKIKGREIAIPSYVGQGSAGRRAEEAIEQRKKEERVDVERLDSPEQVLELYEELMLTGRKIPARELLERNQPHLEELKKEYEFRTNPRYPGNDDSAALAARVEQKNLVGSVINALKKREAERPGPGGIDHFYRL